MTLLVLTAVGDDREGLVSALSTAVEAHGGNWLDSQLARLAGKFAGIVLVDVPEGKVAAFSETTASLQDEIGWKVDVTDAGSGSTPGHEVEVHLIGMDRPGMVRQVTSALAQQRVSIRSFRSWTVSAPQDGGRLFEAEAMVALPPSIDIQVVRSALEPIADELMVDLDLIEQDRRR